MAFLLSEIWHTCWCRYIFQSIGLVFCLILWQSSWLFCSSTRKKATIAVCPVLQNMIMILHEADNFCILPYNARYLLLKEMCRWWKWTISSLCMLCICTIDIHSCCFMFQLVLSWFQKHWKETKSTLKVGLVNIKLCLKSEDKVHSQVKMFLAYIYCQFSLFPHPGDIKLT